MATEINLINMVNSLVGKQVKVSLERDGFDVEIEGEMARVVTEPPKFYVSPAESICHASFAMDDVHSVAVTGGSLAVPIIYLKNNDGENGDS